MADYMGDAVMNTITVTPAGTACLSPAIARVKAKVDAKAVSLPLALARIKLNPVPKGKMK